MYFEIDIDDVRDSLDEIAVIDNGVSFYNYDAHCWVSDLGVTDKMINTSRIALEKQLPKKPKVCDFPEYPTKIGVCIVCGGTGKWRYEILRPVRSEIRLGRII